MARKYLVPIDLTKQELQNARIQNLASAPASPVAGQIYFDTTADTMYFWDGDSWVDMQTAPYSYATTGETTSISITALESDGTSANLARADHQHAGPGFGPVTSQTSYGTSSNDGDDLTVARSDHSHGTPAHGATEHSTIKISDLAAPTTDVSFNSTKITNLADPSGNKDAATKGYVDNRKVTDFAVPTSAFSMNSQKITNLATPTSASDAATKEYVDAVAEGLHIHASVHAATTGTLAAITGGSVTYDNGTGGINATLTLGVALTTLDVYSLQDGDRILVKNEATQAHNGIYTWATGGTVLTRANDFNTAVEIAGGDFVFVTEGTAYNNTGWVQTEPVNNVGSDSVIFQQFSGAGTYTASNGVLLTGTNFTFAPKTDGGLDTGSSGAFVKLPTNSGLGTTSDGLAVGAGTGITVSTGTVAIDTSVVARKYSTNVGNNSNTSFTVTHNLGTKDVTVQVYTVSDGTQVEVDVTRTTTSAISVAFAVAPTTDQYRVVVIG